MREPPRARRPRARRPGDRPESRRASISTRVARPALRRRRGRPLAGRARSSQSRERSRESRPVQHRQVGPGQPAGVSAGRRGAVGDGDDAVGLAQTERSPLDRRRGSRRRRTTWSLACSQLSSASPKLSGCPPACAPIALDLVEPRQRRRQLVGRTPERRPRSLERDDRDHRRHRIAGQRHRAAGLQLHRQRPGEGDREVRVVDRARGRRRSRRSAARCRAGRGPRPTRGASVSTASSPRTAPGHDVRDHVSASPASRTTSRRPDPQHVEALRRARPRETASRPPSPRPRRRGRRSPRASPGGGPRRSGRAEGRPDAP